MPAGEVDEPARRERCAPKLLAGFDLSILNTLEGE